MLAFKVKMYINFMKITESRSNLTHCEVSEYTSEKIAE